MQTLLKGVPGDSLSLTGRYFGPLPGQLAIDGNATPTQTWSDGYLRFTLPALTPGNHTLTVTTAYGQAQTSLQILGSQPIISALRPGNGTPGSTVVLDGYNFGAQQGSATLTVGGQNAPINTWSDQRITFKIPALKTGTSYPLRLTTPAGSAGKTLRVRDLFLLTEYGDCDPGTWLFAYDICPPIILTVINPREGGAKFDVQVENLVDRWYELSINPVGATVPAGSRAIIGPKQKFTLTGVTASPGARIQFFADATSNEGMKAVAFDLLYVAARGSHLPADAIDSALEAFNLMTPDSDLVVFFANMVLNITQGDKLALIEQIRDLPSLAKDPAVQLFLSGYLGLSPEHIARFGNLGAVVHIGAVVIKMLEQLALPRYAASALTAQ